LSVIETDEQFEDALRTQVERQQEEPVSEVESEEAEAPSVAPQPRDEFGRFVPKPEETVPKATYEELQKILGRQGQELGDLRKRLSEVQAPAITEDEIYENPAQVALWAEEQNNSNLYEKAMDAWYQQDPKGASRYEMRKVVAREVSDLAKYNRERQIADAFAYLAGTYPDINDRSQVMVELIQSRPWLLNQLQNANPDEARIILGDLYHIAGGTMPQAPATPAPQTAMRQVPFTETGGSVQNTPPRERTAQDVLREQLLEAELTPRERGYRRTYEPA